MLIDASPLGMNSSGGLTPISTAIVETSGEYDYTAVTVFRKFRTDDGHTWCSISGNIIGEVTIPSGYRPNKDSAVYYIESTYVGGVNATPTRRLIVTAGNSSIGIDGGIPILLGDNIWQVS